MDKRTIIKKKVYVAVVCSFIVIVSFLAGEIAVNQEMCIENLITLIVDGIAVLFWIWVIIEEVK